MAVDEQPPIHDYIISILHRAGTLYLLSIYLLNIHINNSCLNIGVLKSVVKPEQ